MTKSSALEFDIKKVDECPSNCGHPNIFPYLGEISAKRMKKIRDIKGELKEILYCGHCNTLWVQFNRKDWEYSSGKVWYARLRVEIGHEREKWLI